MSKTIPANPVNAAPKECLRPIDDENILAAICSMDAETKAKPASGYSGPNRTVAQVVEGRNGVASAKAPRAKQPDAGAILRQPENVKDARQLQAALKVLGFDLGKSGIDGIKGPATRDAIEQFRQKYNNGFGFVVLPDTASAEAKLVSYAKGQLFFSGLKAGSRPTSS